MVQPLALPHPSEEPIQVSLVWPNKAFRHSVLMRFLFVHASLQFIVTPILLCVWNISFLLHLWKNQFLVALTYSVVQVVDFGEGGPVRCSRCKGYINPFMRFVDQGRKFTCNFCGKCYCFHLLQATQSIVIARQLQLHVSINIFVITFLVWKIYSVNLN